MDAAERALIELGYQIARRDPAEGVLTTQPIEAPSDLATNRPTNWSSRGKARRIAEVRVHSDGGETRYYCRVMIQEQAAQGHRMFAADRAPTDTPGDYTAINRDAATTSEQNTVWRTMRRDKSAERRILDAIGAERTP